MIRFYYVTGLRCGPFVQDAVREQLSKRLDARVARKIERAVKQLASLEAQLKACPKTSPATVVPIHGNEDKTAQIIRKRNEAAQRAAEQRSKQTRKTLTEQRDVCLMRLTAAVRTQERKCDALYHWYALGVAKQRRMNTKEESVTFKSKAYSEFVSSLKEEKKHE